VPKHVKLRLSLLKFFGENGRSFLRARCRSLLNFKVISQRSRSRGFFNVFFCVRDTAATRGEYLALSNDFVSHVDV